MPAGRRRQSTVQFALPEEKEEDGSASSQDARAPASRAAPREADGAFKYKRRKALSGGAKQVGAEGAETARSLPAKRPESEQVCSTDNEGSAQMVSDPSLQSVKLPQAEVAVRPSALAGASPALLHALMETCTACKADHLALALPNMDLALSACLGELDKVGVTSAPPANTEIAGMHKREQELIHHISELERVVKQWDAAACGKSMSRDVDTSAAASSELSSLPGPPDLGVQLEELGKLAVLCADQAKAISQQTHKLGRSAEQQYERLSEGAGNALFEGYADVHEPKMLLRAVLA